MKKPAAKNTTPKPATEKPAKPAPPAPIIIGGYTAGAIGYRSVQDFIESLPMTVLKELLRDRDIPIPKEKSKMVARLANWAVRPEATFILQLR